MRTAIAENPQIKSVDLEEETVVLANHEKVPVVFWSNGYQRCPKYEAVSLVAGPSRTGRWVVSDVRVLGSFELN